MVPRYLELLGRLEEKGVSVDLLDLRTVDHAGIDYDTIGESVRKTGAVVIVEAAPRSLSIGPTVANGISKRFFDELDGPVVCLTSPDIAPPVSRILEEAALISDEEIIAKTLTAAGRQ